MAKKTFQHPDTDVLKGKDVNIEGRSYSIDNIALDGTLFLKPGHTPTDKVSIEGKSYHVVCHSILVLEPEEIYLSEQSVKPHK
ncbi:hypothetical protein [Metabacillus fastidiosus]|uniref:hypothetical protein n=1 Tax=Metabacillus fastidiosus TaxID=1458 RepID=UPI003D2D8433